MWEVVGVQVSAVCSFGFIVSFRQTFSCIILVHYDKILQKLYNELVVHFTMDLLKLWTISVNVGEKFVTLWCALFSSTVRTLSVFIRKLNCKA